MNNEPEKDFLKIYSELTKMQRRFDADELAKRIRERFSAWVRIRVEEMNGERLNYSMPDVNFHCCFDESALIRKFFEKPGVAEMLREIESQCKEDFESYTEEEKEDEPWNFCWEDYLAAAEYYDSWKDEDFRKLLAFWGFLSVSGMGIDQLRDEFVSYLKDEVKDDKIFIAEIEENGSKIQLPVYSEQCLCWREEDPLEGALDYMEYLEMYLFSWSKDALNVRGDYYYYDAFVDYDSLINERNSKLELEEGRKYYLIEKNEISQKMLDIIRSGEAWKSGIKVPPQVIEVDGRFLVSMPEDHLEILELYCLREMQRENEERRSA